MSLTPVLQPACTTLSPITSTTPYMEYPGILGTHLLYAMPSIASDFMSLGAQAICAQAQTLGTCANVLNAADLAGKLQEWAWTAQLTPACEPVSFDDHTSKVFRSLFENNELNNIPDKYQAALSILNPAQQAKVAELIAKVGNKEDSREIALLPSSPSGLISSTSKLISTEIMLVNESATGLLPYMAFQKIVPPIFALINRITQPIFAFIGRIVQPIFAMIHTVAQPIFAVINRIAQPMVAVIKTIAQLTLRCINGIVQPIFGVINRIVQPIFAEMSSMAISTLEMIANHKLITVGTLTGIQSTAKVMASLEKASNDVTGIEPEVLHAATLGAILKTNPSMATTRSLESPNKTLVGSYDMYSETEFSNETSVLPYDIDSETCPIPHFSAYKSQTAAADYLQNHTVQNNTVQNNTVQNKTYP